MPRWQGVPASTLRFYEEKGLIASVGRRGLRRLFNPGVLERLALVAPGRSAGFSLDEIARMFAPDGHPPIDRGSTAGNQREWIPWQLEVVVSWDDEPDGNVRVVASIDDGGLRAFVPMSEDFIESPSGELVGE